MRRLRTCASWPSVIVATSSPPNLYWPVVGMSRQPRMFMSVDFPDPDAPMTATNSPRSMRRLTSSTALTATSPPPYTLET